MALLDKFKMSRRLASLFATLTLLVLAFVFLTYFTDLIGQAGNISDLISSHGLGHQKPPPPPHQNWGEVLDSDDDLDEWDDTPRESITFENEGTYHEESENSRFISNDAWRPHDSYAGSYPSLPNRPQMAPPSYFKDTGSYLKQPLVADYAKNSDKIFLMIKTGSTVLWERLPVHLFTTLTRVPNFGIYADTASSIAGYEVIDVLANVTEQTYNSDNFDMYRKLRTLHDNHGVIDGSETDLQGGWDLDKFKNIPMLAHAYNQSPNSDWFVFMDADTYFLLDNLINWLTTLDPNKPLYMGSRAFLGDLGFAHGGSGVVLSRKALELTVGQHPEYVEEYEKKAHNYCCGDFMVALMLKEKLDVEVSAGNEYPHVGYKFQGHGPNDVFIKKDYWCDEIVSFHHIPSKDVELLWEYERLKGPEARGKIRHADFYKDWYLPYITETRDNWDNLADSRTYSEDRDQSRNEEDEKNGDKKSVNMEGPRPWKSFEQCKKFCEDWNDCYMYRYIPEDKTCFHGDFITLGRPAYDFVKRSPKRTISGWNTDRIRKMRSTQKCDVLHGMVDDTEESENKVDRAEGWYLRQQAVEQEKIDLAKAEKVKANPQDSGSQENQQEDKATQDEQKLKDEQTEEEDKAQQDKERLDEAREKEDQLNKDVKEDN